MRGIAFIEKGYSEEADLVAILVHKSVLHTSGLLEAVERTFDVRVVPFLFYVITHFLCCSLFRAGL